MVSDDLDALMNRLEASLEDIPRQMGVARFWSQDEHVAFQVAWQNCIKEDLTLDGTKRWSDQSEQGKASFLKIFDRVAEFDHVAELSEDVSDTTLAGQLNRILRPFAAPLAEAEKKDPLAEAEKKDPDASHYKKAFSIVMPLLSNDDAFRFSTVRLPDIINKINPETMEDPTELGPKANFDYYNTTSPTTNKTLAQTISNVLDEKYHPPHLSEDNNLIFTMNLSVEYKLVKTDDLPGSGDVSAGADGSEEGALPTTGQEWARIEMPVTYRVPLGADEDDVLALYGQVTIEPKENLEQAVEEGDQAVEEGDQAARDFLTNVRQLVQQASKEITVQQASKEISPYTTMYKDMRNYEMRSMIAEGGEAKKVRSMAGQKRLKDRSLLKAIDTRSSHRFEIVWRTLMFADQAYQKHFIRGQTLTVQDKGDLRRGEAIRARIHKEYKREGLKKGWDRFDRGTGYRAIADGMVKTAKEIESVSTPMESAQAQAPAPAPAPRRAPARSNRAGPFSKLASMMKRLGGGRG
jgi:hypothetical protein